MDIPKSFLRIARPLPLIGQATVLAASRQILNEKGVVYGGLDIALDLVPLLGRAKGLFEIFAGDLVTEQNLCRGIETLRKGLDEVEAFARENDLIKASSLSTQGKAAAAEEPAYYPQNSAKMAMQRAKAATSAVYERREYGGLA